MPASSPTTEAAGPTAVRVAGQPQARVPEPLPGGILDSTRTHPIAGVVFRRRAQVQGRARSIRVRPWGEIPTLEVVVTDGTAALTVAFLGRRRLAGVDPGSTLTVEGMVGERNGKLVILNPAYRLDG
jgi:RecG-like helicase